MTQGRFWLMGCGAMAGAMLARWRATGLDLEFTVIDPARPVIAGVRVLADFPDEAPPERLMLGVKPQALDIVTPGVARAIGPATTVLSILAGVRHARLADRFGAAGAIVRVMPNLPVAIGKGVVALYAPTGPDAATTALMAPLGLVEWLSDEEQFDAVTALSGSGPAFTYRFIDALARGGSVLGLAPDLADRLARATVAGAAEIAAASPETLSTLADRVASKGGSTRVGLDVIDVDIDALVCATLAAAQRRNQTLGDA